MIIGIGTDMVDIRRIEATWQRYGERFLQRVYSEEEQQAASHLQARNMEKFFSFLAKRFAAKEAVAKALGTGMGKAIRFSDASVTNDNAGKPLLSLSGKGAEQLRNLVPDNTTPHLHLSLSDSPPYAQALVVIDAA